MSRKTGSIKGCSAWKVESAIGSCKVRTRKYNVDSIKRNRGSFRFSHMRIVERRIRYPAREEHSKEVLKHQGYDLKALRDDLDPLESATDAANVLVCVDLFQNGPPPKTSLVVPMKIISVSMS